MDELFRFAITRSADRTDATTVALERTSKFQINSPDPGPPGLEHIANGQSLHKWDDLEQASLKYVLSASTINFVESLDASPIAINGKQFLTKIKTSPHASWPVEVDRFAEPFNGQGSKDSLDAFDNEL